MLHPLNKLEIKATNTQIDFNKPQQRPQHIRSPVTAVPSHPGDPQGLSPENRQWQGTLSFPFRDTFRLTSLTTQDVQILMQHHCTGQTNLYPFCRAHARVDGKKSKEQGESKAFPISIQCSWKERPCNQPLHHNWKYCDSGSRLLYHSQGSAVRPSCQLQGPRRRQYHPPWKS